MTILDVQTPVSYVVSSDVQEGDLPPADDPFFYGWREVPQRTNGTEEYVRIPLTLADVLHPQLGDVIVQNHRHSTLCKILWDGLEAYLAHEPDTVVFFDMRIDWEHQTIKPMGPDIIVIRRTTEVEPEGTFYVKQYGGRVDLVVEVTSPSTWKVDVDGYRTPNKIELYAQLGVPCYVVVDGKNKKRGFPPPIRGFQLTAAGIYEEIPPDNRGWLWIDTIGLWLGPYKDWVSWYDADGNKIGTNVEAHEARQREAAARHVAEERAQYAEEHARTEAAARQQEAAARQIAEARAQYEAESRQQEAAARQREAAARHVAEERAQYEAAARQQEAAARQQEAAARQRAEEQAKQAEERIRELEALLRKST